MNYLCVSETPLSDLPLLFYLVVTVESLILYTISSRYDHIFSRICEVVAYESFDRILQILGGKGGMGD